MPQPNLAQLRYTGLIGRVGAGRAMGDVVFGKTAPGTDFKPAGVEFASSLAPAYYRMNRTYGVTANEIAADTAGTVSSNTIKYGTDFFFMNTTSQGTLYKKTAWNAEPTALVNTFTGVSLSSISLIGVQNGYAIATWNSSTTYYFGYTNTVGFAGGWATSSYTTANAIYDVFWTGSTWLVATGSGMIRFASATPTGTSTNPTVSGQFTSNTAVPWYKFFKVGSTIYAQVGNGWWAKSTDDGATWVSFTVPSGGDRNAVIYSSTLSKFFLYSTSNGHLYSFATPDGTWTDCGFLNQSASLSIRLLELTDILGTILIAGPNGYAIYNSSDNTMQPLCTAYANTLTGTGVVSLVEYSPGRVLACASYTRNVALRMPVDFVTPPAVAAAGGRTAYVKVTG